MSDIATKDITTTIKSLLVQKKKSHTELAAYLGISKQAIANKFHRKSYSAEDLIKISEFLGVTLAIRVDDHQTIFLDEV